MSTLKPTMPRWMNWILQGIALMAIGWWAVTPQYLSDYYFHSSDMEAWVKSYLQDKSANIMLPTDDWIRYRKDGHRIGYAIRRGIKTINGSGDIVLLQISGMFGFMRSGTDYLVYSIPERSRDDVQNAIYQENLMMDYYSIDSLDGHWSHLHVR
jgi:hypothetical protein